MKLFPIRPHALKFAYKNNCVEHSIKHGKSLDLNAWSL